MDTTSLESRLENILQADDADQVSEPFDAFEKRICHSVLLLSAGPFLVLPFFVQYFRNKLYHLVFCLVAVLAALYLVIEYRFAWIVQFSDRLHSVFHA